MANRISFFRIAVSMGLLFCPALSPGFYVLYISGGISERLQTCRRAISSEQKANRKSALWSRDWEEKQTMKFKGTLIVVKDCKKALKFYQDMFGFELIRDHDGNMELSGNLYLQEEKYWERFTGRRVIPQCNHTELYFEEPEIERFVKKLEMLYPDIEYVNRLMTHSWGQRVVRFYDPDGNLIEVGTPV